MEINIPVKFFGENTTTYSIKILHNLRNKLKRQRQISEKKSSHNFVWKRINENEWKERFFWTKKIDNNRKINKPQGVKIIINLLEIN
jgi:hypothetical protein